MVKTVFIGQNFLSRNIWDKWQEYYCFYGANQISANSWRVNFSKDEIRTDTGASISTPFLLNIDEGSSLRIPDFFIYIQKDGSVGMRSDYLDNYKGRSLVVSVKFVHIGQDFLEVEYRLAK